MQQNRKSKSTKYSSEDCRFWVDIVYYGLSEEPVELNMPVGHFSVERIVAFLTRYGLNSSEIAQVIKSIDKYKA